MRIDDQYSAFYVLEYTCTLTDINETLGDEIEFLGISFDDEVATSFIGLMRRTAARGKRAEMLTLDCCLGKIDLMMQTAMIFGVFAEIKVLEPYGIQDYGRRFFSDGSGGTFNQLLQTLDLGDAAIHRLHIKKLAFCSISLTDFLTS
jgi:hypothetical protein